MKLVTIPPTGDILEQEIQGLPSRNEIRKGVGGDFEEISYFTVYNEEDCLGFCLAGGKGEVNFRASGAWGLGVLRGNIVLIVGEKKELEKWK